MKNNSRFFSNKECEYYPCHPGADRDSFNCKFCYCPLYMLGEDCDGDFIHLPDGTKDCSLCLKAHDKNFQDEVAAKWEQIKRGIRK